MTQVSKNQARMAGLFYLLIIFFGMTSELVVRSNLIVSSDANLTAQNILAQPELFRFGFIADAIMLLCDVALAVLLYYLFKPVNPLLSLMAMVFRLLQASVLALNLLSYFAALLFLQNTSLHSGFDPDELHSLALFFTQLHSYGYDLGLLFFAFSNFILGYLLIKADYLPSWLGYGLLSAALVYLLGSFIRFVLPDIHTLVEPFYLIPLVMELSFALWLLIKGARPLAEG